MDRRERGFGDAEVRPFRCSPSIVWTRDHGRTLLVHEGTGVSRWLEGLEATAWDLVVLGYEPRAVGRFLADLGSITEPEAGQTIQGILEAWQRQGILEPVASTPHGESGD